MNAEEFLRRRKDRACAIILTTVDREVTDQQAKDRVRKAILDQINDLYCAMVDVAKTLDSGTVVLNELYLERLDRKLEEISGLIRNGHG